MKFFWKIFFAFIVLIMVVFSIFGIWIISLTFQSTFDKEVEEGNKENKMFQYAFEVNLNSLSESYQREEVIVQLAKRIADNLDVKSYIYTIFNADGEVMYTSREQGEEQPENKIMGTLTEEQNCGYEITAFGEKRVLGFTCRSVVRNEVYYLESTKDITEIYWERNELYGRYRQMMFILLVCTGAIIFLISHVLTKSIAILSYTTRRFAKGDYQIRAKVGSEDEIGMLARDFNQMADKLAEKMEELEEAVRKQEDFTASFAHELKTPLTSIIGYADMLRTMDMSKEETMEASNYIYSQGKRLESLSFKLLELIVTDKQDYVFRPVSAKKFIGEIKTIVAPGLQQKMIVMHTQIEKGRIIGEHDLLISLVVNLIDNARKALPEGGHIWVKGRNVETGYELMVMDNGCGMPKEEIAKITEAFYMVDKSRARKEGGAGLGMTLCSKIVALHKAKWIIKSKEGEGTAVWVVFPKEVNWNEP